MPGVKQNYGQAAPRADGLRRQRKKDAGPGGGAASFFASNRACSALLRNETSGSRRGGCGAGCAAGRFSKCGRFGRSGGQGVGLNAAVALPEGAGRELRALFKNEGKIGGGKEAAGLRDLVDFQVGCEQQAARLDEPPGVDVFGEAQPDLLLEHLRQVRPADIDALRHGRERERLVQMRVDVPAGLLHMGGARPVGADQLRIGFEDFLAGQKKAGLVVEQVGDGLVLKAALREGDVPSEKDEIVQAPVQGVQKNAAQLADIPAGGELPQGAGAPVEDLRGGAFPAFDERFADGFVVVQ